MNKILEHFGLTKPLQPMFEKLKDRTLTLDADGLMYEASANSAHLETAIRRGRKAVLEKQYLTGCSFVRAHLTARGSTKAGRKLLNGAGGRYQEQRSAGVKPPLLEPLREAMLRPGVFGEDDGVSMFLHRDIEADDAMMMDSYSIPNVLVYSPDKDLRIAPADWFDPKTGRIDHIKDRYGWVRYDPGEGKLVGHGTAFFWGQMLMGDSADHVKGLLHKPRRGPYGPLRNAAPDCPVCKGTGYLPPHTRGGPKCECLRPMLNDDVGAVLAGEILTDLPDENAAANAVIELYRTIGQNPLPEAGMLWLLRSKEDTAEGYIWSLGLSKQNREFILDCFNTEYRTVPDDEDEEMYPAD